MMYLWRISNYADLKGLGGLRAGGRWHFPGQPVVYLAEHPALAFLEILVHHEAAKIEDLPKQYQLLQVEVPESVAVAEIAALPENWKTDSQWSKSAGTEWLAARTSLLLKVPSVLVPYASNYVLNPEHPDATAVTIILATRVDHDPRILSLLTEPKAQG
ncbi:MULTISPECIES: RES family NAD+ phosphorylase [unclassified Cupriavidus]|uniref:RES family NAD+ phosphorylase n=1 Tax=unclassified Cupriavidus TaxID=2640874 RepID=UPI0012EC0281|nr:MULTISPECIES: RES family NAD+ phosphorylase [unclassified Cupriavidus]MBP0627787.1 RES family NAD+ phosphorylase [Cupriavidus sp. AcVe19-1a]MBP0640023.1 RES family NAD+ phosphorylase [Cupriavidus sp. AcVe19-6a]